MRKSLVGNVSIDKLEQAVDDFIISSHTARLALLTFKEILEKKSLLIEDYSEEETTRFAIQAKLLEKAAEKYEEADYIIP